MLNPYLSAMPPRTSPTGQSNGSRRAVNTAIAVTTGLIALLSWLISDRISIATQLAAANARIDAQQEEIKRVRGRLDTFIDGKIMNACK